MTVTAEMITAGGVLTFAQNQSWFACEISIEKMSAGDGYNRKSITFASAVEAVFANPVFANPNAPVPVILAYESGGKLYNVLDNVELVSNRPAASADPRRVSVTCRCTPRQRVYGRLRYRNSSRRRSRPGPKTR